MVSTPDDGGRRMLSDALAFWLSGRGSARAEDARGTPTQSHISPSILEYTKIDANGQARALFFFFFLFVASWFSSFSCAVFVWLVGSVSCKAG